MTKIFHFSYPPDKRPNHQKLGSATPFEPAWQILVYDWSKKLDLTKDTKSTLATCNYFVLREPSKLEKWGKALLDLSLAMDLKVSKDDEKALLPIKVSSQLVGVEVPEAKKE